MTPSCDLLVITDGRLDYLRETVASARAHLPAALIDRRWMFDDTGDSEHRQALRAEFPDFDHIDGGPRQGFGGAIQSAWAQLLEHSIADNVFHLEQDFTFNRPVDLEDMMMTLQHEPHLAQIALRRQPWNPAEEAAGGVVEVAPDDFTECHGPWGVWLEHRRFFTTNPSVYRRSLMERCWPDGARSEGVFSAELFAAGAGCGYWGSRVSGEAVHHIGHERIGVGY